MGQNKKKSKINQFNILSVNVQFFATLLVIVFAFLSLFVGEKYFFPLEIITSCDLFVMAYNNQKIYQRKNATLSYVLAGVFVFLYAILSFLGVI